MTRAILRDNHEAEDVMQEAYSRAYEHLHDFEARGALLYLADSQCGA